MRQKRRLSYLSTVRRNSHERQETETKPTKLVLELGRCKGSYKSFFLYKKGAVDGNLLEIIPKTAICGPLVGMASVTLTDLQKTIITLCEEHEGNEGSKPDFSPCIVHEPYFIKYAYTPNSRHSSTSTKWQSITQAHHAFPRSMTTSPPNAT